MIGQLIVTVFFSSERGRRLGTEDMLLLMRGTEGR
jgi:hypothetical protein